MQASQLTLTLNNRDGRFSPKNTAGAYTPYIARNVQVRLSINAQSVTGVTYSGYRFWGEVSEWPPGWDVSGHDVYVNIVVSGIWRRLSQLQTTLGSAHRRYYLNNLTGASKPQVYWPMEDGSGSTALIAYIPVTASPGTWTVTGTGSGPSLASGTGFQGSDAIPALNAAEFHFTVPSGGTATNNVTRFLLSVPANGDSGTNNTNWDIIEIDSAGTVAKFEVYLAGTGNTLIMNLRNSSGTVIASATTTSDVAGQPYLVSCELTPSGGNVAWALRLIVPGGASIHESLTGTITSASVGAVSAVTFNRSNQLMDTAVGHLSVTYGAVPSLVTAAYALSGYIGEYAMDRFTRLCGELGIATETIGTNTTTAKMGPQADDSLVNVFQMIEYTDCGLLYETRDQFGLGYRANASMANQAAAVVLSYSSGGAGILDPSLTPAYDDQLTANDITVTNWTGNAWEAVLTTGAMSINSPPTGISDGYALQRNVSAAADSQLAGIATFMLNVGSVDEIRFPIVTVQLARRIGQAPAVFSSLPSLRIGDYFQISGMPAFLTASTVKQLVWGINETINAKQWTISFNSVPESPWETGFSPGTTQIAQIPGSGSTSTGGPGASLVSLIANGSITPAMLNQGITIHTLGGNAVTISATAPATPNINDIWINSGTGLISQWSGSAWTPVTFNATNTIQAGTITSALIAANTIVASNIAAGTITAALLAAGIVVAGIVNSTTITGATIIADGTSGEILVYSGTPALGNLVASMSATAASDASANAYLAGVASYTSVSGTFYSACLQAGGLSFQSAPAAGGPWTQLGQLFINAPTRLQYVDASGLTRNIVQSASQPSGAVLGNSTTVAAIAGAYNIPPDLGLGDCVEIELPFNAAMATTGGTAEGVKLFYNLNGVSNVLMATIGTIVAVNGTYGGWIKLCMKIASLGSGGTCRLWLEGGIYTSGNISTADTMSIACGCFTGVPIDTTVVNTLQLAGAWTAAGGAGQSFTPLGSTLKIF